jgi:hypothetical protein
MSPTAETSAGSPPAFYRLDPGRFAEYRRELVIRLGIRGTLVVAGLLYLAWHFHRRSFSDVAMIAVFGIGVPIYSGLKGGRSRWESLEIEFRDGKLIRRLGQYPVLELVPNDVTAIVELARGITIETNGRLNGLFISNGLSNFDTFKSQLISWVSAGKGSVPQPSPWRYLRNFCESLALTLILSGGPLYLWYTNRRAVILPLGIVLSLSAFPIVLYFRNSPNTPIRGRNAFWFLVWMPILMMLLRLL